MSDSLPSRIAAIVGRTLLRLPHAATTLEGSSDAATEDGREGLLRIHFPELVSVALVDVGIARVQVEEAVEPRTFEWLPEHCVFERGAISLAWRLSSGKVKRAPKPPMGDEDGDTEGLTAWQVEALKADPGLTFEGPEVGRCLVAKAERVTLETLRRLSREGVMKVSVTTDGARGVEVAVRHSSADVLPGTSAHQRHRAGAADGLWGVRA